MRMLYTCFALFMAFGLSAQSLAHDREARLGTGINFTNWLEAYWMAPNYPEPGKYQRTHILEMKEAGMKTIRLPVSFQYFTDTLPPYSVDFNHAAMAWVDSVITWAVEEDMYLVIVNQHGWELSNANFQSKIPRMTALWQQLVQHWAHLDPERYFFEILNEPPLGLLPANVEILMQTCIDSIRALDNSHTLVIDAHSASLGWALASTTPYPDINLIYTFHSYDPYYFTHQGFPWAEPAPFPTGTPFPFLGDDQQLIAIFQQVADWRDSNNLPVWLGEFGVGVHADATSRCNWVNLIGSLIDQYEFNWLYWDWGGVLPSDFDIFSGQGAGLGNVIPCFNDALHLYPAVYQTKPKLTNLELNLFPNPINETLKLRFQQRAPKKLLFQILDLKGELVFDQIKEGIQTFEQIEIDLAHLPSGIYCLRLSNFKNEVWSQSFVKL